MQFFQRTSCQPNPQTVATAATILSLIVRKYCAAVGVGFLADGASAKKPTFKATRARTVKRILNSLDVVPSFPIRRNAASTIHGTFSSIVRRQGQFQVAVVSFQQRLEISNPCVDVLFRAEQVLYSEPLCG